MELKNIFAKGKMNKDADERIIPNGEYIDALNVRVTNTADGDAGTVQNEKGNVKLTRIDTTDNPICIGSVADEANEKIYWFVVDDNGSSFIYEYDNKQDVTSTVLSDTRTGSAQVLNFDSDYKITGVNVIFNKTTNESLLLFTDNLNPPRMVNVKRAKAYGSNNFEADDINLYKKPPRKAPSAVGFNTATDDENAVLERFFSFAYRYKYLDGEYSALSAFTYYQFTPRAFELDFQTLENLGMENTFNAYNITYNTGDKRVTDIQLCFKTPLSDVVFIADTINKEENDLIDNAERTYAFTNKKVYQALPDDEYNRVFDNVPLKALAQDIIEDRIVFGNYTSQYDMVETEGGTEFLHIDYVAEKSTKQRAGAEVDYTRANTNKNIVIDLTGKALNKGYMLTINAVLESDQAGSSPNYYFDGDYTGSASVILSDNYTSATQFYTSADLTQLLKSLDSDFKNNVSTTSPDDLETLTYGTFTKTSSTATSITITAPVNTHKVDNTPSDNTDNDFTDYTEPFKWSDDSLVELLEDSNITSLKSNRSYDFGLVYLDEFGRYSSVIPNSDDTGSDKSNFFVPIEDSVNLNHAKITVKNKPPYWADRYKFFVKTNKGQHLNIYATTYYQDGQYMWIKLNGNNINKVEAGMNLIVKQDDDGAVQNLVKVKVLEVETKTGPDVLDNTEGWLEGNTDADDVNIKEELGTYMKIRPAGFLMNFDEYGFLTYTGKAKLILSGNVSVDLPTPDENRSLFGKQFAGGTQMIDIQAGSKIYFKFESYDTRDQDGNESKFFEREWVAANDYTYSATDGYVLEQFMRQETNWTETVVGSVSSFKDPGDNFTLSFHTVDTQHVARITSLESTALFSEVGHINATIRYTKTGNNIVFETDPKEIDNAVYYETEEVFDIENGFHQGNTQNQTASQDAIVELQFGNCYSFGNGVESISIRDERLSSTLALDYRPNVALIDGYREITNTNALIYSGSFNENSSYNSLNEFNTSRGNTKFLDLKYGSIQKLHARENDLIVLQEDQVNKVMFGKALLYNTDGSASLSKIEDVLGQVVPFAGEYGISKNPESFAEYEGKVYFTDALRGSVLRLGADGIYPVSDYSMRNYFRTNLSTYVDSYNVGGFDPKYNNYVLSMNMDSKPAVTPEYDCASQVYREIPDGQTFTYDLNVGLNAGTLTFDYDITGTASIAVTYDGTTQNQTNLTGTGNFTQNITSANLNNTDIASVVITGVSGAKVEITHTCPTEGTREVVIMVLNDANDAGKTIVNQFKVESGAYYSKTDTFSVDEIARNETLLGVERNPYIPVDTNTITLSSYKKYGYHTGFFNSCSRFGYLLSDQVKTPAQVQSDATYISETTDNNDIYKEVTGTFTFNPTDADDKLYIIFDYQDGNCTPTEESESGVDEDGAENNQN